MISYRDEDEFTPLVREIRRRQRIRWRDWGLFLVGVGLVIAAATL